MKHYRQVLLFLCGAYFVKTALGLVARRPLPVPSLLSTLFLEEQQLQKDKMTATT